MDCKLILVLAAFSAVGCGKSPDDGMGGSTVSANAAATGSAGEGLEVKSLGELQVSSSGPATWSNLPSGNAWTAVTLAEVTDNMPSFERAADKETYCPGYSHASLVQRKTCWIRLISAVAQFESGFDPGNKYRESNGAYSVGLLQLSTGECPGATSVAALQVPVNNLRCGTRKMAALIAEYGYVTSPDNTHGAAAYWSTLRRPYVSGKHHLGKALEVRRITKNFLNVQAASEESVVDVAMNSANEESVR